MPAKKVPIGQRLQSRLDPAPSSCWEYGGVRDKDGYGIISNRRAHRVAWELWNGRPPAEGMVIMHTCDNPPCCNPFHLREGTHSDNVADRVEKGRSGHSNQNTGRTRCRKGHSFTPENTYMTPDGRRQCKTCRAARQKARSEK